MASALNWYAPPVLPVRRLAGRRAPGAAVLLEPARAAPPARGGGPARDPGGAEVGVREASHEDRHDVSAGVAWEHRNVEGEYGVCVLN